MSGILVPVIPSTGAAIHVRDENRFSGMGGGSTSTSSTVLSAFHHSEVVSSCPAPPAAIVYNFSNCTVHSIGSVNSSSTSGCT